MALLNTLAEKWEISTEATALVRLILTKALLKALLTSSVHLPNDSLTVAMFIIQLATLSFTYSNNAHYLHSPANHITRLPTATLSIDQSNR